MPICNRFLVEVQAMHDHPQVRLQAGNQSIRNIVNIPLVQERTGPVVVYAVVPERQAQSHPVASWGRGRGVPLRRANSCEIVRKF